MANKMFKVFNSEIKSIDTEEGTLTASISTSARDRQNEVLDPNGVDMRNFKTNPIVLFAHQYDQPPIGKALWIKRDGDAIVAKVQFAKTEFAQEIFGLFKDGFMKAFSVGFIPKTWEDGDGQKTPSRTYTKWELLEFSAVPVPANPEALMLAIQRGLAISDELKTQLKLDAQAASTDPGVTPEEPPVEPPVEPPAEPEPKNYMGDIIALQAEIAQLKEKEQANLSMIADLENEVRSLRYKIYTLNQKQDRPKAEILGTDVAKLVSDTVIREISRVKGRV